MNFSDLEAYFFMVAQFHPGLPSLSISMETISFYTNAVNGTTKNLYRRSQRRAAWSNRGSW